MTVKAYDMQHCFPRVSNANGDIVEAVLAHNLEREETARADRRFAAWKRKMS